MSIDEIRPFRSLALVSYAILRHLHDVTRNLHLSDVVSPFFACIYKNIFILPIYGVGNDFQFVSVQFDFLCFCVPVTFYRFAEFLCFGHRSSAFPQRKLNRWAFLCHTVNHLPGLSHTQLGQEPLKSGLLTPTTCYQNCSW